MAPEPKQSRFTNAAMVSLHVGLNASVIIVHKDILCNASAFFEKAFNSGLKEGLSQTMTLPEENAELFDILIGWSVYLHAYVYGLLQK